MIINSYLQTGSTLLQTTDPLIETKLTAQGYSTDHLLPIIDITNSIYKQHLQGHKTQLIMQHKQLILLFTAIIYLLKVILLSIFDLSSTSLLDSQALCLLLP